MFDEEIASYQERGSFGPNDGEHSADYFVQTKSRGHSDLVGQGRGVAFNILSRDTVPQGNDYSPAAANLALHETVKFPLWPTLSEKGRTQHYDPEG